MTSTDRHGSRPSRAHRGAPWLLLAATAALGCSGEITVLPGEAGGPETETPTCTPGTRSAQPDPAELSVTAVKTGVFLGDTLHLEATVDGAERYVVLSIDEAGTARAAAMPDDLHGRADLAEIAPGTHARLRIGEDGVPFIDVVDTSIPEAPALIATFEQPGVVDGPAVFAAAEGRFFFCARPQPGETAELVAVDLNVPTEPVPQEASDAFLCYFYDDSSYSASGSAVLRWNHPTGSFVQDTYVYSLGAAGAEKIVDYGYNQDGVHKYGNVLHAATSAERAVFDPENDSLFLIADPTADPSGAGGKPPYTWAPLGVGEERHLLGVAGTTVYLTTDDGLRAYDLTDIVHPELLPFQGWIEGSKGTLRTVATSPRHLAVVDEEGTLFLVPRDAPGLVAPLVVHGAEYEPASSQEACPE